MTPYRKLRVSKLKRAKEPAIARRARILACHHQFVTWSTMCQRCGVSRSAWDAACHFGVFP